MKKLLVMLLLLYPLSAAAETYQWTDEDGIINFAEDLGKVPKKYRKKAKVVGEEGGAPQVTDLTPPAPEKGKEGEETKGKKLYGGKDENAWRRDFLNAKFDVQQSESDLEALKGRLDDISKMSRSEYRSIQNSIKHAEKRLEIRKMRLDQLKQSADRADVPAEFRE